MTQITQDQLNVLMRDLHPSRVKRRSQGGSTFTYLEAYDVKAMLIRVFGFGGFSAECIDHQVIDIDRSPAKDRQGKEYTKVVVSVTCTVRLTIMQTGAVYTETSAASQTGRDVGDVLDFALKTAESDALKRAATYLGTQFALSLYKDGSLAEVVQVVVAPGQEWPPAGDKSVVKDASGTVVAVHQEGTTDEERQKMLEESLGATPLEEPNPDHTETVQA